MHGWSRWGSVSRQSLRPIQSESMLWFIKTLNIRCKVSDFGWINKFGTSMTLVPLKGSFPISSVSTSCLKGWGWRSGYLYLIRGQVNPSFSHSVCHDRNKWRDGSRKMFYYYNYFDKVRHVPAGAPLHVWSRIMFHVSHPKHAEY